MQFAGTGLNKLENKEGRHHCNGGPQDLPISCSTFLVYMQYILKYLKYDTGRYFGICTTCYAATMSPRYGEKLHG